MNAIHTLGFPRIGAQRELKIALEAYWRNEIDQCALQEVGRTLRQRHWECQAQAGLNWVTVGDFSWYDHVLDHSTLLGVVPKRFDHQGGEVSLDTYFRMARGCAHSGTPQAACEMTKWFDTNYHYLVPEFTEDQQFVLSSEKLFKEVEEAKALGYQVKAVMPGPLSYLWLGKTKGDRFDKLDLLERLLPVYGDILNRLQSLGIDWVQLDEPILALDLSHAWRAAFESAYTRLRVKGLNILLATYFGPLKDNLTLACSLPVDGLHVDVVRGRDELDRVLDQIPVYKILSLGVVDGRNVWRADLDELLQYLKPVKQRLGDRLWLAPSCSLLHVPVDLNQEEKLDAEIRQWLAFATQKLDELNVLQCALSQYEADYDGVLRTKIEDSRAAILSRKTSPRIHDPKVKQRCADIVPEMIERVSSFNQRIERQQSCLGLPLLPTTTIGSFPQTQEIRQARRKFKVGELSETEYQTLMRKEIDHVIAKQERIGLDVLVHGEPERNDMVEYFGEQLNGFVISQAGWVQSYGSRCVKPPILFGDISRAKAMTVGWSRYAQSKTNKPMKGMLTGPVTLLNWSFVRDDQPRSDTCQQLALAIRDEVADLEQAGIRIIQIDEAALREGLPLRKSDWKAYLEWTVNAFKLASTGVRDETQIHTHMCYSEFNDIMPAIVAMDADVITIETSRSDMELLEAFEELHYPNDIGPGVYDIHSPNVPSLDSITDLLNKATEFIPIERLWVNPDCGLKTRAWNEVEKALVNMVCAAITMRPKFKTQRKIQK